MISQAERQGTPLPDKLLNEPELIFGLQLYYDAFLELNNSRSIGMQLGAIPWHIINAYCKELLLTGYESYAMQFLLGQMDNAYLKHQNEKQKEKSK